MINYNKLFKKIGYKDLKEVVGASIVKTIKKNEYIRTKTMKRYVNILNLNTTRKNILIRLG